MKQNKNISPFDNILMAYITKGNKGASPVSFDKEAEIVFQKQYVPKLSEDKVNSLLSSLSQTLSNDTLGSLIQRALEEKSASLEAVQTVTGLSVSLLEDIKTDMVFTNSIPVKSLGKLLKFLNVSIEKAQASIDATFEKLTTENRIFLTLPSKVQPAFRKGTSNSVNGVELMRMRTDESYLYQNKEALEKYTKRLGELYNEL